LTSLYSKRHLATYEQQMVRRALETIESSTCIRFDYTASRPAESHIYYVKIGTPTFCGLSYIGKVSPANPIYLSFGCQDPVGVAIHETMHALGVNHHHLRGDRDEHIKMEWDNVNPQFYDYFAIADSSKFTTYGTPYDFASIMHYGAFTAAIDMSRPTMTPKSNRAQNLPIMGQRKRLSQSDINLLNAMYCKSNCQDRNVYCGVWSVHNLCRTQAQLGWMEVNCRKSCGFC
jgi:astacin